MGVFAKLFRRSSSYVTPNGNERLQDFPYKTYPVSSDLLYLGDSANANAECQSTIAQIATAVTLTQPQVVNLPADLASKLPLAGGTLTGALFGTSASFSNTISASNLSLGGNLTTAGALTTTGAYGVTFNFSAITNATFPAGTYTIATVNGTISSILGTANQINANTVSTVTTLSFPSVLHTANGTILDDGSANMEVIGNLKVDTLSASQAVVTNSSNQLISLAYTNTNTGSTLVQRDSFGNFSAGTITASLTGHASLDLLASNNLSDVANVATAATNLGLGTANNVTFANLTLSGLSASEAVITDSSKKLTSLIFTAVNTPSTIVSRDSLGAIAVGALTASSLSVVNTSLANLGLFNNVASTGSFITFNSNGKTASIGVDGSGFANIQTGALVLTTDSTDNLPIYFAPGYTTFWSLKVAPGGVVSSPNNILDDGSSNATISGNLDVGANASFNGTTFTFGSNTSGSPATMYLIGSSINGSDEGHLWFYKTGTTPTANGDALGEIAIYGVNSSGTSQRAARIMAVSTAPATTNSVQTELAYRFTDPSGAEQIPFILTYQGFTLNGCPTTFTGGASVNFNFTGATNVTFPTSGTLATVGGTISSVVGTSGRITVNTVSGVSTVNIDTSYIGQSSITTLGTISTGSWNASLIPLAYGGTNANLTASANSLVYSTSSALALLATANNGVLVTSNTGVPSISSTLPSAVQLNITQTGTITTGVWNGSIIDSSHGGTGLSAPSPGYMLCGSGTPGNYAFIPAPSAEQILGTDVTGGIFWLSTLPAVVQSNITETGTISTGTWHASTISPTYGGTGLSNPTAHGILVGEGSSNVNSIVLGAGQILIGTTSSDPSAATLTPGSGISINSTSGSITISATGDSPWTVVTSTSATMAANNGYITNNSSLVTLTLPATAAVGDIIKVQGEGTGGWKIAQLAGQQINFGSVSTASGTGGSLSSTNQYDSLTLVCIIANTTFAVMSGSQGNISVVTGSGTVINNAINTDPATKLNISGGTMTGNLILNSNASSALQAVPLQQLQNSANSSSFVSYTYFGGL